MGASKKCSKSLREPFIITDLTLPNNQASPSVIGEASNDLSVSGPVRLHFRHPVLPATLRGSVEAAPFVAMPKTTVYEYHGVAVPECDVRPTRKIGGMESVSIS